MPAPPSPIRRAAFLGAALVVFAGFLALGTWQLERRVWKLDLIARVEQRVHAAAVPAPGPRRWPQVGAASDEYRRVAATGVFLTGRDTLVQASTDLGGGFWVLTPLRVMNADNDGDWNGGVVLVNRGFVPPAVAAGMRAAAANPASPAYPPAAAPSGSVTVTGLLRASQPGGGFLRRNDAAGDRWFSRDVRAIAAARDLSDAAPYFIDADAGENPAAGAAQWPVGGLTVIAFPDNHLVYALTWYALALMTAAAAWLTRRTWHARAEPPILPAERMRGERDNGDRDDGSVH